MLPAQRLPYWEYCHPQTPALVTVARGRAIGLKQRNCVGGFAALLGKGFSVFGVSEMLCIVPLYRRVRKWTLDTAPCLGLRWQVSPLAGDPN